jgi:bacterial/archaeal transporter family protein
VRWVWVAVTVISGTLGDLLSARGMALRGEARKFKPRDIAHLLRYIVTHPLVVLGIACNAIAFFAFVALLSVSDVSFAVPATGLSYLVKVALANYFLGERVTWRRWAGAVLVMVGVVLISL